MQRPVNYYSQQDFMDSVLSRGLGDPDAHGYPDESKHDTPAVYKPKHWSRTMKPTSTIVREPREFGDNDPASPEQAGW